MELKEDKKTYKKASLFSATRTLKRFFDAVPDQNTMNKTEMLAAAGRDGEEFEAKNEGWLSGKLTALYAHSLVKPAYSYDPWKKLEYIELTPKGKMALNRDDAPEVLSSSIPAPDAILHKGDRQGRDLTIDEIVAALPMINEKLEPTGVRLKFEEVQPTK